MPIRMVAQCVPKKESRAIRQCMPRIEFADGSGSSFRQFLPKKQISPTCCCAYTFAGAGRHCSLQIQEFAGCREVNFHRFNSSRAIAAIAAIN
ncbi:hypothetical protein ACSFBM_03135 [Variovorax sp. GB1R11]|uniref:hypothetical protein n=1 Tax=Variovorax sp. GB1R11 TaxID=3443741 RepID=UPI003F45CE88